MCGRRFESADVCPCTAEETFLQDFLVITRKSLINISLLLIIEVDHEQMIAWNLS